MAAPTKRVDLGFVDEDCDDRLLRSHFFPSKVGGKPAWLSFSNLPSPADLSCRKCGTPCVFLLQAYAPRENQKQAFHRTIFVFVCKNPKCCSPNSSQNFRVFRSQLHKLNDFYSVDPPNERNPDVNTVDPEKVGVALCAVCGCAGPKKCGKCQSAVYCGKEHQTIHWKAGHKQSCCKANEETTTIKFLFPESELVMEEEEIPKIDMKQEKSETEKLQEYQNFLKSTNQSYNRDDLEKSSLCESEDNKQFTKFKARIAAAPEQMLRYEWGGEPLWMAATHKATMEDIPPCKCGAPRHFEFQILPQLLNYLKVDSLGESLDWGTLCIYTCSENCDIGNNYQEEFLWKQDILEDMKPS